MPDLSFSEKAWEDYIFWQSQDKNIKELLKAVTEYSQLNREEFWETVKKAQTSQQSSEITRLKSRDQMEWVSQANNVRSRVDEIVLNELVYV